MCHLTAGTLFVMKLVSIPTQKPTFDRRSEKQQDKELRKIN
jgi:hypothetical protein